MSSHLSRLRGFLLSQEAFTGMTVDRRPKFCVSASFKYALVRLGQALPPITLLALDLAVALINVEYSIWWCELVHIFLVLFEIRIDGNSY